MKPNPVGTGPFKFVSYDVDVSYKVMKNPDYWAKDDKGNQLPYLDGIEYIYIADTMTQEMSMENGEADMLMGIAPGKTAADLASLGLNMEYAMDMPVCLIPDTANSDSPWSNQKVREAVEYAIDRETIAKALGYGYWQAPYQIPPRDFQPMILISTLGRKYNLDKAKQLLTEAGYPTGFRNDNHNRKPAANKMMSFSRYRLTWPKLVLRSIWKVPCQSKIYHLFRTMGTWHNAAIYMSMPTD